MEIVAYEDIVTERALEASGRALGALWEGPGAALEASRERWGGGGRGSETPGSIFIEF